MIRELQVMHLPSVVLREDSNPKELVQSEAIHHFAVMYHSGEKRTCESSLLLCMKSKLGAMADLTC